MHPTATSTPLMMKAISKTDRPWSCRVRFGGADGGLGGADGEGGAKGGLGECGGEEGGYAGDGSCGGIGGKAQLSSQQPVHPPSQHRKPGLSQLVVHWSQLEPPWLWSHVRPCQVSTSHTSYLSSGSAMPLRWPCVVLPTQSEAASSRSFQPATGPMRRSSVATLTAVVAVAGETGAYWRRYR